MKSQEMHDGNDTCGTDDHDDHEVRRCPPAGEAIEARTSVMRRMSAILHMSAAFFVRVPRTSAGADYALVAQDRHIYSIPRAQVGALHRGEDLFRGLGSFETHLLPPAPLMINSATISSAETGANRYVSPGLLASA